MKKLIKLLIISFTIVLLIPISVFSAGSVSVTPSDLTIEVGSSKTFNISFFNIIGDAKIVSNNPNIAAVTPSEWETGLIEENKTKNGTITVTGKNVGTTTITITLDGATFEDEPKSIAGQTRTVTVNVIQKSTPAPEQKPNVIQTPTPQDTRSSDNSLKSISIDGYQLTKVDNNNYILNVDYDTTNININAEANDKKATVAGVGNKNLQIGSNTFTISIKAENGSINNINVAIMRKDGNYIEDLDKTLEKSSDDINIKLKEDTIINKDNIEKIKNSKKTVKFNKYDANNQLIYTLIIDGNAIENESEIYPHISKNENISSELGKLTNYSNGILISFDKKTSIPANSKLRIYVGDKFTDNDKLNIYSFNKESNKIGLIVQEVEVSGGYIEYPLIDSNDMFITQAVISDAEQLAIPKVEKTKEKPNYLNLIIIFAILVILFILYILKIKDYRKLQQKEEIENKKLEDITQAEELKKIQEVEEQSIATKDAIGLETTSEPYTPTQIDVAPEYSEDISTIIESTPVEPAVEYEIPVEPIPQVEVEVQPEVVEEAVEPVVEYETPVEPVPQVEVEVQPEVVEEAVEPAVEYETPVEPVSQEIQVEAETQPEVVEENSN